MVSWIGMYSEFERNHGLHTTLDAIFKVMALAMDARDYEEDVAEESFNTYRAFAHLFGHEMTPTLLQKELESVRSQFEEAVLNLETEVQQQAARESFETWWPLAHSHIDFVKEDKDLLLVERPQYTPLGSSMEDNEKWIERKHTSTTSFVKIG
ncbi:expressed unknown protein [Seminavis robusta]|uniref:Uncharacterized protein n=1 Tax=Seminavis robusta TaxID=568900 RepID=A0A9N8DR59_9STRA|nr:expressed unknown protein [Seminavis robusta]|eukprot:Sro311_g114430.1 n/a (153) ;mRNA; f:76993-77451